MKQIIEENKSRVRAIIRRLTGTVNEDLEQEVFIKTWQNMDRYQEQGKFRQWISVLATNICRDYFKSRAYHTEQCMVGDDDVLENIGSPENQEEILDAKTRQKIILKAVDSLPKKMRQTVVLFEFEGWSYEQIARKTGEPAGTIKSRLYNARKILSEKLKHLKGE